MEDKDYEMIFENLNKLSYGEKVALQQYLAILVENEQAGAWKSFAKKVERYEDKVLKS